MNIDWTTALIGAAAGYYVKDRVEDAKSSARKAVSETAAAAAAAAARAAISAAAAAVSDTAISGQTQPAQQPTQPGVNGN